MDSKLNGIYHSLYNYFGPQHWWPAKDALEVMIGAVLTQNTAWANVERAIENLKIHNLLSARAIFEIPTSLLASLIRPAGYFNIKAKRLKNLISFFMHEYDADPNKMFTEETDNLRERLLSINGIGKETADSILLYAGQKPIFVVDAYTKRVMTRHLLIAEDADYNQIQEFFMDRLSHDARLFNEFHALLVRLGKVHCRKKPLCQDCPLNGL